VDDPGLPFVGRAELELEAAELDPELVEGVLGLLQREGGLHPRLGGDAADAQARPAELRLPLDAGDARAQLRGADGRGVPTGAASEYGDVDIHRT
jgi:hypothetical protein